MTDFLITAICLIFFWIPCIALMLWATYSFIMILLGGVAICPPRASC